MACICPLCENEIPAPDTLKLIPEANLVLWPTGHVQLTEAQFLLFEKILDTYPKRVTLERLAMHYYVNYRDPDDPPADAVIRVQISIIRRKLRAANAPFHLPQLKEYGSGYVIRWNNKEKVA